MKRADFDFSQVKGISGAGQVRSAAIYYTTVTSISIIPCCYSNTEVCIGKPGVRVNYETSIRLVRSPLSWRAVSLSRTVQYGWTPVHQSSVRYWSLS